MNIKSTTGYNYSPKFGAKLAPQTLKALEKEIAVGPQGDQALKKCLETVRKLGHKDTVIAIGNTYKQGEYCYVGYDYPDEWVEFTVRDITVSNPLLGTAEAKFTQNWGCETLEKTINSIDNSSLTGRESFIFAKHLQENVETMPMKIFGEIMPFLKQSKETFKEVFDVAKKYNEAFLKDKKNELENLKKSLITKEELFNSQEQQSKGLIEESDKLLLKDEMMNERERILSTYA